MHINIEDDDAGKVKAAMDREKLNWRSFVDRGPIAEKWKPAGTPSRISAYFQWRVTTGVRMPCGWARSASSVIPLGAIW